MYCASTLFLLFAVSCAALSGFYYDNGLDQTVVHKHLNKLEKREMQSEILHLLGLQHRPHPALAKTPLKKQNPNEDLNSAPRFLIDLYQSLTEEDSGELKLVPTLIVKEFNVSDSEVDTVDQADVIMSFINHGQHLRGIRHHHSHGRMWFDLSEVPKEASVMSAELRIFINPSINDLHSDNDMGSDSLPQYAENETFSIALYQVGSKDDLVFLEQLEIQRNEGWIVFNVTNSLRHWLLKPEDNFGLQLVCRSPSSGQQISTREVGIIGSHGDSKLQPFMVAFFRNSNHTVKETAKVALSLDVKAKNVLQDESNVKSHRVRRQTSNRKRSKDNEEIGGWNPYTDLDARLSRRSCQKKNLYVSFRDLGWQDWIIAPDGYAASYCNGECSFPLNAHMNASNHAIVQTLVHLMNPYRVPKPCCAPIKLSSISVLYFDDNSNVILKKYRNMVVKSCGCH